MAGFPISASLIRPGSISNFLIAYIKQLSLDLARFPISARILIQPGRISNFLFAYIVIRFGWISNFC